MRSELASAALAPSPPSLRSVCDRLGIVPRFAREKFPDDARRLSTAHAQVLAAQRQQRFTRSVDAYTAAAVALKNRGVAVGTKYLQQESGLVAFTRNDSRVRALRQVLEAHGCGGQD
jgi:hypothetical protein